MKALSQVKKIGHVTPFGAKERTSPVSETKFWKQNLNLHAVPEMALVVGTYCIFPYGETSFANFCIEIGGLIYTRVSGCAVVQ